MPIITAISGINACVQTKGRCHKITMAIIPDNVKITPKLPKLFLSNFLGTCIISELTNKIAPIIMNIVAKKVKTEFSSKSFLTGNALKANTAPQIMKLMPTVQILKSKLNVLRHRYATIKQIMIFINTSTNIFILYSFSAVDLFFFFGCQLSASTAKIIITDPTQSIGTIVKLKTITEPIVADTGSNASSKLAVDG